MMIASEELQDHFYDLVLKKNLELGLKSFNCYLELAEEGRQLTIMCPFQKNNSNFKDIVKKGEAYFKANNLTIDIPNRQLIAARKYDFTEMSPEIFSLCLLQFHSELLRLRQELENINQ